jgi:hypothetical protein
VMKSPRTVAGMPAFHLLVGGLFALLFTWPFVALGTPSTAYCFLMGAWALSIGVAFLLSQGHEDPSGSDGVDDRGADGDV